MNRILLNFAFNSIIKSTSIRPLKFVNCWDITEYSNLTVPVSRWLQIPSDAFPSENVNDGEFFFLFAWTKFYTLILVCCHYNWILDTSYIMCTYTKINNYMYESGWLFFLCQKNIMCQLLNTRDKGSVELGCFTCPNCQHIRKTAFLCFIVMHVDHHHSGIWMRSKVT